MTRVKLGAAIMAALLIGAYTLAQAGKEAADGKTAVVEVSWSPSAGSVVIIARVAMKDRVAGHTFTGGTFSETYPVKRGDAVLVTVDTKTPLQVGCSITVTGQPPVTNSGVMSHLICGPVIVT